MRGQVKSWCDRCSPDLWRKLCPSVSADRCGDNWFLKLSSAVNEHDTRKRRNWISWAHNVKIGYTSPAGFQPDSKRSDSAGCQTHAS